jgi:hypothetical protein
MLDGGEPIKIFVSVQPKSSQLTGEYDLSSCGSHLDQRLAAVATKLAKTLEKPYLENGENAPSLPGDQTERRVYSIYVSSTVCNVKRLVFLRTRYKMSGRVRFVQTTNFFPTGGKAGRRDDS